MKDRWVPRDYYRHAPYDGFAPVRRKARDCGGKATGWDWVPKFWWDGTDMWVRTAPKAVTG